MEDLWGLCKPVYVEERPGQAVLSTEKELWSTCRPVYVQEKIERTDLDKAVFTAVEAVRA